MVKNEKPYLTQYCEMLPLLRDDKSPVVQEALKELRHKAKLQSGLTGQELALIVSCRKFGLILSCCKKHNSA